MDRTFVRRKIQVLTVLFIYVVHQFVGGYPQQHIQSVIVEHRPSHKPPRHPSRSVGHGQVCTTVEPSERDRLIADWMLPVR